MKKDARPFAMSTNTSFTVSGTASPATVYSANDLTQYKASTPYVEKRA